MGETLPAIKALWRPIVEELRSRGVCGSASVLGREVHKLSLKKDPDDPLPEKTLASWFKGRVPQQFETFMRLVVLLDLDGRHPWEELYDAARRARNGGARKLKADKRIAVRAAPPAEVLVPAFVPVDSPPAAAKNTSTDLPSAPPPPPAAPRSRRALWISAVVGGTLLLSMGYDALAHPQGSPGRKNTVAGAPLGPAPQPTPARPGTSPADPTPSAPPSPSPAEKPSQRATRSPTKPPIKRHPPTSIPRSPRLPPMGQTAKKCTFVLGPTDAGVYRNPDPTSERHRQLASQNQVTVLPEYTAALPHAPGWVAVQLPSGPARQYSWMRSRDLGIPGSCPAQIDVAP